MKDKIILGAAQLGLSYGINNKVGKLSQEGVFDILQTAAALGVKKIDTALAYGDSHKNIASFHKNFPTKKFQIITKTQNDVLTLDQEILKQICESLEVDDLYGLLFHSIEAYRKTVIQDNIKKSFRLGLSIYSNEEGLEALSDSTIKILQLPFNVFDNWQKRSEFILKAKEKKCQIHVRSVFLQGLFFMELEKIPQKINSFTKPLIQLASLAQELKLSMHELTLRYIYSFPEIDGIIIGIDHPKQLLEHFKIESKPLNQDILREIHKINLGIAENFLHPRTWQ